MLGVLLVLWVGRCEGLQQWQSIRMNHKRNKRFTSSLNDYSRTPIDSTTLRRGRAAFGQSMVHASKSSDVDGAGGARSGEPLGLDTNSQEENFTGKKFDSKGSSASVEADYGIWDIGAFEEAPRDIPESISKHLTMPPLKQDQASDSGHDTDAFWAQVPVALSLEICAEGVNGTRLNHRFASLKFAVEAMTALNGGDRKDQPLWALCGLQNWLWQSGRLAWPRHVDPQSPSGEEEASSSSPSMSWWELLSYRLAQDVLLGGALANVTSLPPIVSLPSQEPRTEDSFYLGAQAWQRVWAYDSMESRVALVRHGRLNEYLRSQVQTLCWSAVATSVKPLLDGTDPMASAVYAALPSNQEQATARGVARMVDLCEAARVSGSWQLLTTITTNLNHDKEKEPPPPPPPPLAFVLAMLGHPPHWLLQLTSHCLRFASSFHKVRDEVPSAALRIASKMHAVAHSNNDDNGSSSVVSARSTASSAATVAMTSSEKQTVMTTDAKNHLLASCALLVRLCAWCLSPRRWLYMWQSLSQQRPPVPYRFAPGSAEMIASSDRRVLASWLPR